MAESEIPKLSQMPSQRGRSTKPGPKPKGRKKNMELKFEPFKKIPRLSRECFITEKIDGTNGVIHIDDTGTIMTVGSRSRWITPEDDNYGFARWARSNEAELLKLGPGFHYGEWWGEGVQRGYGVKGKRFSLFNVGRWADALTRPACCDVVPTLYQGVFSDEAVRSALNNLAVHGSSAAPGFMRPEGIIIYHVAANQYFKKTIDKDEEWKGKGA